MRGVFQQRVTGRGKSKWIPKIIVGNISRTWRLVRFEGVSKITQVSGMSDCVCPCFLRRNYLLRSQGQAWAGEIDFSVNILASRDP